MEKPQEEKEAESLENSSSSDSGTSNSNVTSSSSNTGGSVITAKNSKKSFLSGGLRGVITRVNIYFLLFVFIIVLSGLVVFIGIQRSKKDAANPTIATQKLTQDELQKLQGSDSKVGDAKQTLSIESNAIFTGKVLLRDSLDVAGTLKVGGALSLPGLNVSGNSVFDQLQANKAVITGDATIQGQLNIQKNLVTSGGAQFGGPITAPQITVSSFQLSGDLTITRHIDAGGGTPGKSNGGALGSGGTTSISGTDTAGTLTINTGGGTGVGCFATIDFTQRFGGTPHVVVTPIGSAAAGLNYYVNRSSTGFSVCTTNPAPAGQSFSFDYIVID
jgi:cytoskeletal protein CcmA (bactofilin family)